MIDHEGEEQEAIFQWINYNLKEYPELDLLFHIPNGGKRYKATAVKLKKQGVKAGVPDLFLPVAKGSWHGLFIELKYGKNKPTELQEKWLGDLYEQGYYTVVCYGWQEAVGVLKFYLDGKNFV